MERTPFLRMTRVSKQFGAVAALRAVDLDIHPGEVIGVVGDTNSGKSTLLRLLAGVLSPDGGTITIDGRPARLTPTHRAARRGIRAVHQDINLAEHMTGLGYIFGSMVPQRRLPLRWLGWWNPRQLAEQARGEFERLGFPPPPLDCPLHDLTSAQRKMVAFVHATIRQPRLLLLDEPMSALEDQQAIILRIIQRTRDAGSAVLLVTQNLDDIFSVSDRIVALSDGQKIAERRAAATSEEEIVSLILRSVEDDRLTPAVWALSNYFEVRRQADELDRLNKVLERRAVQLQAHADVARTVTSILDRDELLTQSVRIFQQRFGYYHTALFLLDAATGEVVLRSSAGRETAAEHRDVRIQPGPDSLVGWCAATGQHYLANDVTQEPRFRPTQTLPYARAELVLPLRVGARVLGVLDVQSERVDAFAAEDVVVLQSLVDQIAIAIRNADLFDAAQVARQQADRANRFKSIFLSNMSHELRTPLSAIIGLTQAMISPSSRFYDRDLPDDYRHDLTTIRKSGEHLLALINDILDLSKIEAGELTLNPAVVDLQSVLDDAVHATEALLHDRPIALHAEIDASLPLAWCDSIRTRQIMFNLLSNAVKFTERGQIRVRAQPVADGIQIAVADTGIGIPERWREVIFDRFQQGEVNRARKYGGSGLGLSISRQLVELQGGRIAVESAVGQGTTITFTVPRATPDQIAAGGRDARDDSAHALRQMVVFEPEQLAPASTAQLVLLAADDTPLAVDLRAALEAAGYVVEQIALDAGVLDMTELMLPDLVILDQSTRATGDLVDAWCARFAAEQRRLLVLAGDGEHDRLAEQVQAVPVGAVISSAGPDALQTMVNQVRAMLARAPAASS